jgi:ribose-phosphate pyrophosphokinase
MKIFSGRSCIDLANKICENINETSILDVKIGNLKIEKFSDGEILPLFLESVRDEDVFFVQSTISSDSIIETLLVIDAAKRAGCKSFTLISPFQGYSRQDKTDHLRSSIGSKMLVDVLEKVGMSKIITIDLHNSAIQGFFNVPVIHLNGNLNFIEHIKKNKIPDLTILAPDQGAVKRASDFCKAFPDATFAMINKKRTKPNEISSMELVGDVYDRNVIIVDDMIDTGGTLKKAADLIMQNGARSVRAIATHGVLSGNAFKNIDDSSLSEVMISDSIDKEILSSKINVISCSSIISKAIVNILQKKSIDDINKV